MKKVLFASLILAAVMAACKDEPAKKTPATTATDSSEPGNGDIDTVLSAEVIQQFSTNGFTDYVKKRAPDFDWKQFRMTASWTDSAPLVSPFRPDKVFYSNYGPFLRYSPDSSHFIDLDSYNVEIRKDGKGAYTGHELGPDTEISLVDAAAGNKTRLLFMGPGGSVEDGLWIDNNTLVLVGVQDNGEALHTAPLWRYDVPTHTFYVYESRDTSLATKLPGYWKEERLKKVKIQ